MKNDPLKEIRVATPCTVSWESMSGDERVRHCSLCSLNVYNFQEMTRDEIRTLLIRTEGRVCGRMYRRADGTLLTRDCPSGFQVVRQRMSRVAAAVTAALFSVAAFASDGATCEKPRVKKHGSKVKFSTERLAAQQKAAISGVVLDENGDGPVPGVTVTLRDETTQQQFSVVTDIQGRFNFSALSDGIYRVDVTLSGFLPAVVEHLQLKQSEVTNARVALRVDPAAVTMGIVSAVESGTTMPDGPSTTFSQQLVNKLPH